MTPSALTIDKRGGLRVSEAQVQRACIDLLRAEGWIVRPAPRDGRKAIRGAYSILAGEPDLIAVKSLWVPGRSGTVGLWRVLFLECKAEGGEFSLAQEAWAAGQAVPVYLIRSVTDLRAVLRERA